MIHPSKRARWAERVRDLLVRPSGRLVCLEFPTKMTSELGPPYCASFWHYQLHLSYPGNERVVNYETKVIDTSSNVTSSSGSGLTMLARFPPPFTHNGADSENGPRGRGWISIWGLNLGGEKPATSPDKTRNTIRDGTAGEGTWEVVKAQGHKLLVRRKSASPEKRSMSPEKVPGSPETRSRSPTKRGRCQADTTTRHEGSPKKLCLREPQPQNYV